MSGASSFRSHVQTLDDLRGPAGRLEALLNTGREDALYVAVVAHPHPPSGGTMHTKAVYHATKAFSHFGLPVLRFNFRSAGLSEGEHDEGVGEVEDVRAALDWLDRRFGLPILFAGFSFGSKSACEPAAATPASRGSSASASLCVLQAATTPTTSSRPAEPPNSSSPATTTSSVRKVCSSPFSSAPPNRNALSGSRTPTTSLRASPALLAQSLR